MLYTENLNIPTEGNTDILDITPKISAAVDKSGVSNGIVVVFNVGSTAAISTIEYEPGLVNFDIAAALAKIAPENGIYEHEKTWHDDNGHAHVRATLMGPSLSIPILEGQLTLGTWQQICLIDFDTRARTRKVVCQIIGE